MSLFRVDVLDAGGNKVGTGPLTSVISVSRTRSMDKIGTVQFDLPATDPATAMVGAGRQYRIYHADYGLLGTYFHAGQSTGAGGTLKVKAYDALIELARKNCYFRRTFDNVAVETVIGTLVGLATGWTSGAVETGIGNATASIEGESVMEAITELGNAWGRHWRLGTAARSLDFGSFGTASGIRLIKADSLPPEIEGNTSAALVTDLSVSVESEAVVNRLIPLGAGAGTTQLTLEYVTVYDESYPVQTGHNADGSHFYYIEDTTSQTAYGLVERPFVRNEIRPLSNSLANLQNAANALYQAALATLLKLRNPVTQYTVSVTNLNPASVLPGDTVRLFWRGIVTRDGVAYKWLDVNADLYVLDIAENWGADGSQKVTLTVATSADRRAQDEDIIAGLVRQASVTRTHVQTNLSKDRVGPYLIGIDSTHTAVFSFGIGNETLALNYAFLRFKTRHLRTNVKSSSSESAHTHSVTISNHTHSVTIPSHDHNVEIEDHFHGIPIYENHTGRFYPVQYDPSDDKLYAVGIAMDQTFESMEWEGGQTATSDSGGGTTATSSSGGGTTVASAAGSAHSHGLTYGFYEDSDYPDHISVYVDGVDRTSALGGTWADGGAAVETTVEITDYVDDQATLRGNHTVEFRCTGGQGEIEAELVMLMTVQAIAVT
jgi:hypothetical protein